MQRLVAVESITASPRFNIDNHENILKAALGENIGTTVGGND